MLWMQKVLFLLKVLLFDFYSCFENLNLKNWNCKNSKEDFKEEQEFHKENKIVLKKNKEEEKRWLIFIKKY